MGVCATEVAGSPVITVAQARSYFAMQAAAGGLWWILVFASDGVRRLTLGDWDPWLLVGPDVVLFVMGSLWVAATSGRLTAVAVAIWTAAITTALLVYGLVEQAAGWGVAAMAAATVGSVTCALTLWFGQFPTAWFFQGPFAFRPAPAASETTHVRRSLAQLVVFWTAFFVAVPLVVVAVERRLDLSVPLLQHNVLSPVGWALFAVGSLGGLWSCLTMAWIGQGTPLPAKTARRLVIRGPYAYVRNPMAVAGATQTAAIGLVVGSWIVIVFAVAGGLVWNAIIRPVEEADLAARFGDDYDRYRNSVRCWVPTRLT